MPTRPLYVFLLVAAAQFAIACSSDDHPTGAPPADEIQTTCQVWADVGCRKNKECVGIDTTVEACTAAETTKCVAEMNDEKESCRRNRIDAIDSCSGGLEAETCESYCSTDANGFTFCYYPCTYFCPAT